MPDDLRGSIPYIIRLIEAFNIPIYGGRCTTFFVSAYFFVFLVGRGQKPIGYEVFLKRQKTTSFLCIIIMYINNYQCFTINTSLCYTMLCYTSLRNMKNVYFYTIIQQRWKPQKKNSSFWMHTH